MQGQWSDIEQAQALFLDLNALFSYFRDICVIQEYARKNRNQQQKRMP